MSEFGSDLIKAMEEALEIAKGNKVAPRIHRPTGDGHMITEEAHMIANCKDCEQSWIGTGAYDASEAHVEATGHDVDRTFKTRTKARKITR